MNYWVIDGHLEDCPYLRALQWNEEDGVECDCRERQEDDGDHCIHATRGSYEDDWDGEDDYCVHCECCCTCLSCEYGPRDGMPFTLSDAEVRQ